MRRTITFRSRWGRIGTLVVAGLAALLELLALVQEGWRAALVGLPLPLMVLTLVAWLWWWPAVTTGPAGVLVRNHFREIAIPWNALEDTGTRFGLRLRAGGHEYVCAAPPERGGFAASRRRTPAEMTPLDDTRTVHHLAETTPEVAARMIMEERLLMLEPDRRPQRSTSERAAVEENLSRSPIAARLDAGFPASVRTRWVPWPALAVLVLLLATAVSLS